MEMIMVYGCIWRILWSEIDDKLITLHLFQQLQLHSSLDQYASHHPTKSLRCWRLPDGRSNRKIEKCWGLVHLAHGWWVLWVASRFSWRFLGRSWIRSAMWRWCLHLKKNPHSWYLKWVLVLCCLVVLASIGYQWLSTYTYTYSGVQGSWVPTWFQAPVLWHNLGVVSPLAARGSKSWHLWLFAVCQSKRCGN